MARSVAVMAGIVPGSTAAKPLIACSFAGDAKELRASQGGTSGTEANGPALSGTSCTFKLRLHMSWKGSPGI